MSWVRRKTQVWRGVAVITDTKEAEVEGCRFKASLGRREGSAGKSMS